MPDLRLSADAPDLRSRCPDCRGSGAIALLDSDPPTTTEVVLDGVRVDHCPRCVATGLAKVPLCGCGAICGAPGQPCFPCASREMPAPGERVRQSVVVLCERFGSFAAILAAKHNRAVELPGGKVEPSETTYAAAAREAAEELGVPVRVIPGAIGEFEHTFRGQRWCCTAYRGDLDGAHPRGSVEGEATWATRDELLAGTHGDVVRRIFEALDSREGGHRG